VINTTVGLLVDIHIAHTDILRMRLFQTIEIQRGIFTDKSLDDLCGQEIFIVSGMVSEQHFYFGTLFEHDEHTTIHHQVNITA
jgi:hypothetical protein